MAAALALLRHRLTGLTIPTVDDLLEGASKHAKDLADLLDRTVSRAESNSQLVTGPRGCGKTAVVQAALADLKGRYASHNPLPYIVVHLDGLVLTDDRAALSEIAWQLAAEQQLEKRTFGSFADTLAFLLTSLRKGNAKTTTPVLFVLNEIDQFALHPKQTLLYNLFDIVQSQSAPVAVVGITCRLDFVELLEKRVKSRFSHRHMEVKPLSSADATMTLLERILHLPDGSGPVDFINRFNGQLASLRNDSSYTRVINSLFDIGRDTASVLRVAYLVVSTMDSDLARGQTTTLSGALFQEALASQDTDLKVLLLVGVSVLELSLVVAMKHLVEKKELSSFSFETVYKEYHDFMSKHTSVTVELYNKPVAFKAFEQLLEREFVRPTGNSMSYTHRELAQVSLHLDTSQIEDAIAQRSDCPVFIKRWATQWAD